MSWSYDPSQLETNKKDQVRFRLADTNKEDALLQDEEIDFILKVSQQNVQVATLQACAAIIALLGSFVDFKVGPYSESQSNRLKAYQLLYQQLHRQMQLNAPIAKKPTTRYVFHYDMMSLEGYNHE